MALANAHEGYEYQDLLTCYFILQELLDENEAEFLIDRKEFKEDKMDDLIIIRNNTKFKKQIKYSSPDNNHVFSKSDLAADSAYQLSLDSLYESWLKNPDRTISEFRLCLSWQEPVDEILDVLRIENGCQTFPKFPTTIYKIDGKKLWPENAEPLSSWRRFKSASHNIDRNLFLQFCESMIIEVLMPKFSLNLRQPGDLESVVLEQAKDLGIGTFPNVEWTQETFLLGLLAIIKRARSKGQKITTASVFHEMNIITDYGSIEQLFPVVEAENIERKSALEHFMVEIINDEKVLLVGEPGSGKSWFIENLTKFLRDKDLKVVRHFCYTKLDDALQRDRIRLDIFYGNLISDIIEAFPKLKKIKKRKYASNLNELNNLLEHINEPTYLIVDGLDHIERIASYRDYANIAKQDIAIIESIAKLKKSSYVKFIVTSQKITKLDLIPDFVQRIVPGWDQEEVTELLKKVRLEDKLLKENLPLSKFLLEKSSGNPLYLKYLVDEIKKLEGCDLNLLAKLPPYSFNLAEYYRYLISQLNTREDVPQVLSGVNFSLSKTELEEITHSGDYVSDSLVILSPVLRMNISQSGYMIYHESFRRYIMDELKSKSVSIEQKVFRPIKDWLASKNFYTYRKSFRYHLQFLYEGAFYKEVLELLQPTYVTESVINGYSWESIEKNYRYFVKSACELRDFPAIVLLNEIDKILSNCPDHFADIFILYLKTLGEIRGFAKVSEYLVFEGEPTLGYIEGLKACYICDENGIVAPWALYMPYFSSGKAIQESDFIYFVRGLLVTGDNERIDRLAHNLVSDLDGQFAEKFREECLKYHDQERIGRLAKKYSNIRKVLKFKEEPTAQKYSANGLLALADEILAFDSVYTNETAKVIEFFEAYTIMSSDEELTILLLEKFRGINWFYNWIIYYLKIILINAKPDSYSYPEVKSAFDVLKNKTEPFEGKPRACDLYSLHPFIYQSYKAGLKFIKTEVEWKETIDTLVLVSNGTTTYLQKSMSGPLSTDNLFRLLSDHACDQNIELVNSVFEKLSEEKEEYQLHMDIAEYNLRLASITAATLNKSKAEEYFRKAVQFALAYTLRKDITLVDAIEGIKYYSQINLHKGITDLKTIRILVDSVVSHTDGKGTDYFPISWYKSFLAVDLRKATLFLLNEIKDCRYDWRAEKSLIHLLCFLKGNVHPEIEAYLAMTFPATDAEEFVDYCLLLFSKLKDSNPILGEKLLARIIPLMQPKKDRRRNEQLVQRYNDIVGKQIEAKVSFKNESVGNYFQTQPWYNDIISERGDFGLMSEQEMLSYFDANDLRERDLVSLFYIVDGQDGLSAFLKEIIPIIVNKNNRRYRDKVELDIVFQRGDDIECYYWVCRFVNDHGGWFEKFVNQEAFLIAHRINSPLAFSCLFELMPAYLDIGFNSEFSANLIQLLVSLGYDPAIIESMWDNLLKITSYRLPFQEEMEWDSIFENEFELSDEEILICMLISRYRAGTTERFQWATAAIANLFETSPDRFIKPFQWFFTHRAKFLKGVETVILQLIFNQKAKDGVYHKHFEAALLNGFPSKYFMTDFIICQLYDKRLSTINAYSGLLYPSIDQSSYRYLLLLNYKFRIFDLFGVNLEHCFSKHMATFNEKYQDYFELYANRAYRQMVPHIYGGQNMLDILNIDLYQNFTDWSNAVNVEDFTRDTFISVEALTIQVNSFGSRPDDLIKSHEIASGISKGEITDSHEWIRLGHYESELRNDGVLKLIPFKSYGGVSFATTVKSIPYFPYFLAPYQLWVNGEFDFNLDDEIVISVLQDDSIEALKLLWLNPAIVRALGLTIRRTEQGLTAVTEGNEVVLKMRSWRCDYLGDGIRTSLSDEIPKLVGTDLVITKQYFKRVCALFNKTPSYFTYGLHKDS